MRRLKKITAEMISSSLVKLEMKGEVKCIGLWDTVLHTVSPLFLLHSLSNIGSEPCVPCVQIICIRSTVLVCASPLQLFSEQC